MGQLGGGLEGRRYAYRRGRGAEHHLIDMTDFIRSMRSRGKRTSIRSVDVDGAFGAVPHKKMMNAIESLGVNRRICRYLATWLPSRVFRAHLITPNGRIMSSRRKLSMGPSRWSPLAVSVAASH